MHNVNAYTCDFDDTELQTKHERKMTSLREELDLRRKTEIHEVEEVCIIISPSFNHELIIIIISNTAEEE